MATNDYGEELDSNGYAKSLLQHFPDRCYLCGRSDQKLDRHEIFHGSNREKSKRLGLWVLLCHERCHIFGDEAVHGQYGAEKDMTLRVRGELAACSHYGWMPDKFMQVFGKNYI